MEFWRNDYLSWYIPRVINESADQINLHSSGVKSIEQSELTLTSGDPYEMATRFEEGLASWLGQPPKSVLYTPGATGGTLLALLTLVGAGESIMVETPIYEPMLRHAHRAGRAIPLVRRFEDGWRLPLDDAQRQIDATTRVVMITEPHNPSGRLSPKEDIFALAEIAARHDAVLLINEVYLGYTERPTHYGLADNIVVVSSLSKLTGAYWARLGWLSAPRRVTQQLRGGQLNMGMPPIPCIQFGISLLDQLVERQQKSKAIAHQGIEQVEKWMAQMPMLDWQRTDGPGFACVKLPPQLDDAALAHRLCEEHNVLLIPGHHFQSPGTVRLAWLQSDGQLINGLTVLKNVIEQTIAP